MGGGGWVGVRMFRGFLCLKRKKNKTNSTETGKCCSSGASACWCWSDRRCFTPASPHPQPGPPPPPPQPINSPLPVLRVEEELELLEEELVVTVEEELQEEAVVVQVEDVVEEAVEAGTSPSMSAALWECERQRALMGSKPSCRRNRAEPSTRLLVEQLFFSSRWRRKRVKPRPPPTPEATSFCYLLGRLIGGPSQTPPGPLS